AIFGSEMFIGWRMDQPLFCQRWTVTNGDAADLEGEFWERGFSGQICALTGRLMRLHPCSLIGERSSRCCCFYRTCMRN
ncbi:hypothetical protein J1N35_005426, partial [Gossypium stocksii]